jgi:hypothetical protein
MTKHDRTYLQVQAQAAVDKAIKEPGEVWRLEGYKAGVKGRHDNKLTLWVSADNYCVYDVTERAELEAQLVDDWALEQGDEPDKENDTMDLRTALARIAAENPAAAKAASAYLTGSENRTELQRFRVTVAEMVRIQQVAQRKGTNASDYVRNATLKQLAQDELELGEG